jgi:amidase
MNGVVAMKPSRGVVSGEGIVPLVRFQDSAGPVARRVRDAALLLGVLDRGEEDYTARLDEGALKGVPVGILRAEILAGGDREEQEHWLRKIDAGLARCGAVSRDVAELEQEAIPLTPVLFLGLSVETLGYLASAGAPVADLVSLRDYLQRQPERRMPRGSNLLDAAARFETAVTEQAGVSAAGLGGMYEEGALAVRETATRLLERSFLASEVEVLVSLGNAHSQVYATAGYPAITVPLGRDDTGKLNGVTLIGKPGRDAFLLACAYAFEQATQLRQPPRLVWE